MGRDEVICIWEKESWITGVINDDSSDESWDMCLVEDLIVNSDCYNFQEEWDMWIIMWVWILQEVTCKYVYVFIFQENWKDIHLNVGSENLTKLC